MPAQTAESLFPRLEPLLPTVQKPIQYVGGELNSTVKDWDAADGPLGADVPRRLRGRPAQPGRPDPLRGAQRARLDPRRAHLRRVARHGGGDARARRSRSSPSTATGRCATSTCSGSRFSTELGYTNMLNALDLAGIPLHAVDRGDDDPIVLAGGHAAFNPEPIADFLDAAVLGDGEEVVLAISEVVREWKAEGRPGRLATTSCSAGSRSRRRLRARSSTTSTYAADGAIERGRAQPARRPVPGAQAHADGPRRVALPGASRWCRWPRPCTSGSASRSSAAARAAAASARPA